MGGFAFKTAVEQFLKAIYHYKHYYGVGKLFFLYYVYIIGYIPKVNQEYVAFMFFNRLIGISAIISSRVLYLDTFFYGEALKRKL